MAALALAACTSEAPEPANQSEANAVAPAPANTLRPQVRADSSGPANRAAPAPGDDRTPVSEAPFTDTSAQSAANVVQTYYALLEAGRAAEAWRLWSGAGEASGLGAAEFAARRSRYREYHAEIFAPGAIEGAAGSLYVDVPVRVYGRTAAGAPFERRGTVTLRRVNDVPGSTAEQRRWHIARSDVEPPP
jgi:hypothetical protein